MACKMGIGIESHQVQWVACVCGTLCDEGKLSATITFAEWVDRI